METSRPTPSSSSRRVLLRHPSSSSSSSTPHFSSPFPSTSPPPPPIPPDPSHPPPPRPPQTLPASSSSSTPPSPPPGVVVVGFVGRQRTDVSQILNRVIDSNVFGSGNRDKVLIAVGEEEGDEVKEWFRARRISYYHDYDKGIVYLQMCSIISPVVVDGASGFDGEFGSALEELEFGDLKGLLLMFTVCHVIIYIQEGSHFHVELLRKFRVLQSAKHALASSLKLQNKLPSLSGPSPSPSRARISSKSPPRRGGNFQNRQNPSMSNMSSDGLYTSLFPGQCTPVMLFVFVDDHSGTMTSTASIEESKMASSSSQISSFGNLASSGFPVRGSGSVVVLARPTKKSEGGSRRKLQSSLEAQIRFLIKKCRTLSSSEISHAVSRNRASFGSLPLLTLDASRAVVLVDSYTNRSGEALDFVSSLVEDVLNGKAAPDSLLLETHVQNGNWEDIGSLKEFIFRQADILRGKGSITNANSGAAAGVGMVAAAAAAAAVASASSRRLRTTPELPSLPDWLSSTRDILKGLLSAQHCSVDDIDINGRKFRQRNGVLPVDGMISKGVDPLDLAASLLDAGKGMNSKFSTSWCQRAFPTAVEVYLKDLPPHYPTSLHEAHLEKALQTLNSIVKGASVKDFMKRLEDECTSIWKSGRQSCDAVSLTGRSCVHPRHDIQDSSDANGRPHSSEFVFFHACACGRTRRPRADPFDFESANVTFNCLPDCDKLIPAMQLPKVSDAGSSELFAWHVIRVGDSRNYDSSKGLPQSGFSASHKFLMKWTFAIEKDSVPNVSYANAVKQGSSSTSSDCSFDSRPDVNVRKDVPLRIRAQSEVQARVEVQRSTQEQLKYDDRKISFGKGLPKITMKKPFSEVVAGSAASDSAFPPLQAKRTPGVIPERGPKNASVKDGNTEQAAIAFNHQTLEKDELIASTGENFNDVGSNGKPSLQIGSNVFPLNVNDGGKGRLNLSLEQILVYVGVEHECPRGHRFILSLDLLDGLGSSYSLAEEAKISFSVENEDYRHRDPSKLSNNSSYGKLHLALNDSPAASHKGRNVAKTGEMQANSDPSMNGPLYLPESGNNQHHTYSDASLMSDSFRDLQMALKDLDDGGQGSSLLNRDLPIYMNCPQCRISKNKKDKRNTKFAGTVSQLQRIFVVTPPLPVVLATDPVVQFEESCQHLNFSNHKQLQFSLGCPVILPPESFVSIRLPFIYGVPVEKIGFHPLKPSDQRPEITAWIQRGTILRMISKGSSPD